MKLSIIVLSYNTKDLTAACINSIIKQYKDQLDSGDLEVILVDNASTDGSVKEMSNIQCQISNVKLIENRTNLGFSKGNNIGAKEAKGDYLLFLNSDTEVLDKGFFKMLDFLNNNKDVGVLGCKLKFPDGKVQSSCGKFYNLINSFLMLFGFEKFVRFAPNEIKLVDWVSGAAFMTRKDLFSRLNGFDENIFMYTEDMELCFRVKKESLDTFFFPDCNIIHKEGKSSNRTFAILEIYKGLLYFYRKHKSGFEYFLLKVMLDIKAIIAILIGYLTRNTYLTNTYKKAFSL